MQNNKKIEWRKANKVYELLVKDYNQYEIAADILKISQPTIFRDIQTLDSR